MRDLAQNLKVTQVLTPATRTADANGASVDMQGYDSLMFIANVGVSGDTLSASVKAELELEESDNDSDWTDVADADLIDAVDGTNDGTFAVIDDPAEDDAVHKVGYRGSKRYVRPVLNLTGAHTNGIPVSISAVQGHAAHKPVA